LLIAVALGDKFTNDRSDYIYQRHKVTLLHCHIVFSVYFRLPTLMRLYISSLEKYVHILRSDIFEIGVDRDHVHFFGKFVQSHRRV